MRGPLTPKPPVTKKGRVGVMEDMEGFFGSSRPRPPHPAKGTPPFFRGRLLKTLHILHTLPFKKRKKWNRKEKKEKRMTKSRA